MLPVIDRGVPVVTSRQGTTGLSPNVAGDRWNYIVQSSRHECMPIDGR